MSKTRELKKSAFMGNVRQERFVTSVLAAVSRAERLSFHRVKSARRRWLRWRLLLLQLPVPQWEGQEGGGRESRAESERSNPVLSSTTAGACVRVIRWRDRVPWISLGLVWMEGGACWVGSPRRSSEGVGLQRVRTNLLVVGVAQRLRAVAEVVVAQRGAVLHLGLRTRSPADVNRGLTVPFSANGLCTAVS